MRRSWLAGVKQSESEFTGVTFVGRGQAGSPGSGREAPPEPASCCLSCCTDRIDRLRLFGYIVYRSRNTINSRWEGTKGLDTKILLGQKDGQLAAFLENRQRCQNILYNTLHSVLKRSRRIAAKSNRSVGPPEPQKSL
jgi:hypothetical protein